MSIKESFEEHPYIWVSGGLAALVAAYLLLHHGSSSGGVTNFTYQTGPNAAQLAANTQLAIAQSANQTAVSLANIQAATGTKEAGDYFSFLKTNSANALKGLLSNNATATGINANNNATSLGVTKINDATSVQENAANNAASLKGLLANISAALKLGMTQATQAQIASSNASASATYQSNNQLAATQANDTAAIDEAGYAYSTAALDPGSSDAGLVSSLTTALKNLSSAATNLIAPHSGQSAADSFGEYTPAVQTALQQAQNLL